MADEEIGELEKEVVKANPPLSAKFADGLRAVPPILGCTAAAYILDFAGFIDVVKTALPAGPNVGYHLAAGAGLYGGWTENGDRKLASLAVLACSMAPEAILFGQEGDIQKVGTAAGLKLVGYGLCYVISHLTSSNF